MADDRTLLWGADLEGEHLDDWRILYSTLHARFETGDFATGLRLVAAIGEAAGAADHHPDVDLSYGRVDVRTRSHDVGGVTARDVRLARRISDVAADLGATARPEALVSVELALDTPAHDEVKGFWAALLGYEMCTDPVDQIVDPDAKRPTIWFQQAERDAPVPSQRWHLDVRVPPEVAEARIQACLDAGGTLVDDRGAPAFWVLADPQGNRACVCTWQGREQG
jgi:4a-hydroxytetrahydrobiopterin dehydratase